MMRRRRTNRMRAVGIDAHQAAFWQWQAQFAQWFPGDLARQIAGSGSVMRSRIISTHDNWQQQPIRRRGPEGL